jgi:predicted transcriptional regulator
MTPLQKQVIELLSKNSLSPGQIVDAINLEKYKSRQHAVRSINNIVKKLYEDGFLERAKAENTFIYSLSGKLKTLVVKA